MNKEPKKINMVFRVKTHQTLGDCIKELIDTSYLIYKRLLESKNKPTTIVCGGQSPSYFCLAMMHFQIFDPKLVNIVILPHSKGGIKSKNQELENKIYSQRIRDKGIQLNNDVVIIDGVHTGVGILALESALKYTFPDINVYRIAINFSKGISEIYVDEEIAIPCEPRFSDDFPRLVQSFYPGEFEDNSKFITHFINVESNPIAEMITSVAKDYPKIQVQDTEWYKLNNEITPQIALEKVKWIERMKLERKRKHLDRIGMDRMTRFIRYY